LKVVDCINDFFHAPYACIAFDFLQFSQLLSVLKWKQQPMFQGCCKKITSVISLADKKYSVVIVNTDIQTRHDW